MKLKTGIVLCGVALMVHGTSWSGELHVDFRHQGFDNTALRLVGPDAEQLVSPTERGLLMWIPANEGIAGPVGVAARKLLHGDFEIVAEYELLRYDRPRDGSWVGVGLVVEFPTVAADAITLARLAIPTEGDRFVSADLPFGDGRAISDSRRAPAWSRTGKLLLVRAGTTVRAYYAEGGEAFKLLREREVGHGDARLARLGPEAGAGRHRVEVLLSSLTVTADEFAEPPESPAPSTSGIDPVLLGVGALDILLIAFAAWRLWPKHRGSPSRKTPRASGWKD